MTHKKSIRSILSQTSMHIIMAVFSVACMIPLVLVLSISFTDEATVAMQGYSLIPQKLSTMAYEFMFRTSKGLLNSYKITIFVTVVGTLLSLAFTSMLAYPLSRKVVKLRGKIAFFIFIPILFGGGMVPFYILVTKFLGMKDSIWVMIIPYLVGSWNVILMRNYYLSVPESITEAAKIDGAGDFRTFVQIVIPLSKPAFATIGLFVTMGYWNDWWLALLFVERRELFPLQYMLQAIMQNIDVLMSNINTKDDISLIPSETIRMATCVMAVGPILLAYPFFQKFIVKGLTVGAVKG